jgi:signal recognition particle GTPase
LFDALTDRLSSVFDRLSGRGVLSEKDVAEVMREIRVALLEADVALPVVRDFIAKATEAATGEAVIRSVRPADQVVKITYDGLVDMLGGTGEAEGLNISLNPPSVILMAGLQGSGKTTTAGKLALRLVRERKKVLMASLDTRRPAAMEQLGMLAEQAGASFLPIVAGQAAPDIARRAMQSARLPGFDILILDTAGRTTLDEAMMSEAAEIAKISSPAETLLVADALTGQDAVRTAKAFHERLPLTGLVLTRADGDGRGGAALFTAGRAKAVTIAVGVPAQQHALVDLGVAVVVLAVAQLGGARVARGVSVVAVGAGGGAVGVGVDRANTVAGGVFACRAIIGARRVAVGHLERPGRRAAGQGEQQGRRPRASPTRGGADHQVHRVRAGHPKLLRGAGPAAGRRPRAPARAAGAVRRRQGGPQRVRQARGRGAGRDRGAAPQGWRSLSAGCST